MLKAFLIAWKEVRLFLRDRGDLAYSLLLPIAVFALMYGAFSEQSTFHGTCHIVNEDSGGKYSTLLLERLQHNENLDMEIHSIADANRKLENSDLQLVLFIPRDFSQKLEAGQKTSLIFTQRGNGGQEGQIVSGIVRSTALQIGQEIQVLQQIETSLTNQKTSEAQITTTVNKFLDRERKFPVVQVVETTMGGRPDPAKQFFPGIMTMFILFAITLNAHTIVEERKKGTLERLMTTQLTSSQLFVGKFLAGIFRGFVQTFILLVLTYVVFQFFTPVTFLEILLIALIFSAAASAIGLFIAVLVHTEAAAIWVPVFITMGMTMLGGTFFTISHGSIWDSLSKISINTYANNAITAIVLDGSGFSDIAWDLAILGMVAVAGLLTSRVFFRVAPGGK